MHELRHPYFKPPLHQPRLGRPVSVNPDMCVHEKSRNREEERERGRGREGEEKRGRGEKKILCESTLSSVYVELV